MRLIALSLIATLAACGGKSKPAPTQPDPVVTEPTPTEPTEITPKATPSDAELDTLFAGTLEFFAELGDAAAANEKDCAKMAAGLEASFNRHQALLDQLKAYKGNEEVDQKGEAYMQAHQDQLGPATEKLSKLQACANDPAVQKVMERFEDL